MNYREFKNHTFQEKSKSRSKGQVFERLGMFRQQHVHPLHVHHQYPTLNLKSAHGLEIMQISAGLIDNLLGRFERKAIKPSRNL